MAMDYDELLGILGEFGRYQKVVFFLVCLVGIQTCFNNMSIVFIGGIPDHWCNVPVLDHLNISVDLIKNASVPKEKDGAFSKCLMYDQNYTGWSEDDIQRAAQGSKLDLETTQCKDGWTYDTATYTSTIVSEWNLVCGRKAMVEASQSVYMAGLMVGVILFGAVSDHAGRKPAFSIALVLGIISAVATAFSPNYIGFVSLRFLVAMASIGLFTTGFVIGVESVGPSWRVFTGIVIEYYWAAGYIILAGLAYGIRDWFHLQLAISVPIVLYFLLLLVIPESPRWLYSNNKHEKADVIVRKMAKVNKVELPEKLDIIASKDVKKAYLWDIFRYPRMRLRSLNIFFNWFVNSVVYYGLSFTSSSLGGNEYINFLISGAVEIPAYMMCQLTMNRLGRRWTLGSTMIAGGVALLLTMAIPEDKNIGVVVLAMFGKFCISASFAIVYVFTAELFPTVLRNVGVGAGSFWGRVGGVVAPQIGLLRDINRFAPLIMFGIASILAGGFALLLPETMGRNLPETLQDAENFGNSEGEAEVNQNKANAGLEGSVNPAYDTKL